MNYRLWRRTQDRKLFEELEQENAALRARWDRAERALTRAGFEDKGGQEWKPPINKDSFAPKYFALEARWEKLKKYLEDSHWRWRVGDTSACKEALFKMEELEQDD